MTDNEQPKKPEAQKYKPLDVLIVEDVDQMLKLLEHVVGGIKGLAVSGLAKNGWEARIEITKRRPDVILLDEILPGESAVDLLNEFQSQGIPVILVTGVDKPTHEVPANALGRIVKPGWRAIDVEQRRMGKAIFGFLRRPQPAE